MRRTFRMLLAAAIATGLMGWAAAPASASPEPAHPCHEYTLPDEAVQYAICMQYYLLK